MFKFVPIYSFTLNFIKAFKTLTYIAPQTNSTKLHFPKYAFSTSIFCKKWHSTNSYVYDDVDGTINISFLKQYVLFGVTRQHHSFMEADTWR